MAGSKSDRKIDATFNIFANNQDANDAVRVGYIDPKRGYISGLTVYQANKYAERNPGTQFIIANRDKVRYININEVNRLKNSDTLPKHRPSGLVDRNSDEFDPCNTVRGFKTDPDTLGEPEIKPLIDGDSGDFDATANYDRYGSDSSKCRTRVELQGGGGIGAVATPIIGKDGSIIHVRVVHGGFGYKYPPQVRIVDDCRRGAGARGYSRLGSTGYVEENFDEDTDVENYDFSLGEYNFDPDDSAWGSVYSMANQTVIGDWNPANVISLTSQTGFHKELQDYLGFLKGYDPNKPWWTTRDETPVRITGDGASKKSNRLRGILFPVQHPAWGGEKSVSKDLVSVEFEVYGQGTRGNRSITYEFTAQDGSHKFKVKGIQSEKVNEKTRVDVIKVKTNTTYNVVASVIKGRGAKSEVIEQGLLENAGRKAKENRKFQEEQRSATIFADIVASLNDNDDLQITAKRGKFKASNRRLVEVKVPDDVREKFKDQPNRFKRATFDLTYRVNVPSKEPRTIKPSFMNNYAVSPQLESDQPGTDKAGKPYSFFYKEYFPHDGVYTFRGSSDNISEIIFDGESIMDISNTFNSKPVKVKKEVKEGLHEIRIDLLNTPQKAKPKPITKDLSITYYGLNKGITKTLRGEKRYPITVAEPGTINRGPTAKVKSVSKKTIQFTDAAYQNDKDAEFKILSTSPGVTARFSGSNDGNLELVVKGKGDVTLQLEWNDDPRSNGEAVGDIRVAGERWKQTAFKDKKGDVKKTINVGAKETKEVIGKGGFRVSGNDVKMKDGHGDDINSTFSIVSSTVDAKFSSDGRKINYKGSGEITLRLKWDDNPRKYGKAVDSIAVGGKVWDQKGEKGSKTQTIKVTAESSTTGGVQSGKSIGGVTYTGPELFNFKHPAWSELMNKISVSPYTPPLNEDNPDINGTFTLKWSGVKFSENGRYDVAFQADNIAKLFINGTEVQEVRSFRGEPRPRYVELSRGTYDIEIQLTNIPTNRDIFNSNPSGVALRITKELTIVSSESPAWTKNPVGASAMIIPPPCPKVIEGTGFVERIDVIEPGNGHPPPEFPSGGGTGIPVTLQLVDIVPTAPGIGYTPGDRVIVEVPGRPPIEFEPELDTFGRITRIPVTRFPLIPPPGDRGGTGDPGPTGDRSPTGFDIIGNSETQILQVKDLPGEIGVADDTGVLIPLIPSGGTASGQTVVPAPGPFYGFTEFPNIYPTSNTGLGFRGRPVFEVVVVPENILPDESVLQVVDIPGLRQTGYVNGKPYYGQVFAKDGNLYAGISETIGQLVPVYATLQESILNRQTVEPSAILRTGTETNSNDPTLNIPNTPDNLI